MKRFTQCLIIGVLAGGFLLSTLTGLNHTNLTTNADSAQNQPAIKLSCQVPFDVTFDVPHDPQQQFFDIYSWNIFIAVNWPACTAGETPCTQGNGMPNCQAQIGATDDGPTVWETYKTTYEVFKGDRNGNPIPVTLQDWNRPDTLPPGCLPSAVNLGGKRLRVVRMVSKDSANEFTEAFAGPLIDQHGHYARYEIRMNYNEFQYIVQRRLYDSRRQSSVDFPPGMIPPPNSGLAGVEGAIEIKAAWKVLDPSRGDDPSRYHTQWVVIAWPRPHQKGKPIEYNCSQPIQMGLVGLHIAHKTQNAPQWIWSTFEQVDNYKAGPNAPPGLKPSFNNPACKTCTPNVMPAKPWNPDPAVPQSPPVQVVPGESATVAQFTANENQTAWNLLKTVNQNTVWQYYQLVSTQWPRVPYQKGKPSPVYAKITLGKEGADQAPLHLANTTMETYFMGPPESQDTSSCMHCHSTATGLTTGATLDFSYALQDAYPAAASARLRLHRELLLTRLSRPGAVVRRKTR